jgi:glyoxylase-like metal-dependent hydrolase (beta-lactamase superfamily II)
VEVISGFYQLRSPIPNSPLGYINSYLVQGSKGWLLVDTGWNYSKAFDALRTQLAEIGLRFSDISQIVVTHIHPDHYGLAGRIRQLSEAKLALHQRERAFIQLGQVGAKDYSVYILQQLKSSGMPDKELPQLKGGFPQGRNFLSALAAPDIVLQGGERISTGLFDFEVVWTPGHTPGHICLYEPERKILLSGDHILPSTTPNISLHPQSEGNPLGDYLASLKGLESLRVDLVLPGHEYVFQGLKGRIEALLSHHEQRLDAILDATKDEPRTTYEVASVIPWVVETEGKVVSFEDLAFFDKWLAIGETLAHLELLRREGKMEKALRNGIVFYNAV